MEFLLQNKILILFFLVYLLIVSVVAFAVTVYDKWAAVNRPQERTRESTLLLLSALGGSLAMLFTMLGIRHKTKHLKFMIGIPVIIVLQIAAIVALLIFI